MRFFIAFILSSLILLSCRTRPIVKLESNSFCGETQYSKKNYKFQNKRYAKESVLDTNAIYILKNPEDSSCYFYKFLNTGEMFSSCKIYKNTVDSNDIKDFDLGSWSTYKRSGKTRIKYEYGVENDYYRFYVTKGVINGDKILFFKTSPSVIGASGYQIRIELEKVKGLRISNSKLRESKSYKIWTGKI